MKISKKKEIALMAPMIIGRKIKVNTGSGFLMIGEVKRVTESYIILDDWKYIKSLDPGQNNYMLNISSIKKLELVGKLSN